MSRKDRSLIALLLFFIVVAFTVELYWIVYRHELVARAETEFLASLFRIYAAGDREYFDISTPLPMALESFNVFVTQILNIALIHAIVSKRSYRHPLQILVGSYLAYSVLLYFLSAHFSGYASMGERTPWGAFLFVVPNLPWLLGYGYLAYDGFVECRRQFCHAALSLADSAPPATFRLHRPARGDDQGDAHGATA